jgi:DNA-binding NarL/FixJ family response regulator
VGLEPGGIEPGGFELRVAINRRVVVGERDPTVRAAVSALIGTIGLRASQAWHGADVMAAAEEEAPALVLLSVDLEEPCAYEVLHRLRERYGPSPSVALLAAGAGHVERDEVAALLLGADDYFEKPLQPDRFIVRVRRMVATPRGSRRNGSGSLEVATKLTNREREVLTLLVDGCRSAEIAEVLCVTRKTAATHIERILAKLEVRTQAQAVACAVREGIVDVARHPAVRVGS